jgi:hypothetical protein
LVARQQQIESEQNMSNSLKSVVESGAHSLQSGAHTITDTLSDLVDEARSRIEDLPPLARPRRKRARRRLGSLVLVGLLVVVILAVVKRGQHESADPVDQTSVRRR